MGSPWSSAVLLALVAVCHGIPCPAEDPVVRPIAEVLSMPAAELAEGVPVRVRGVVVLTQPNLAVQEGSSGIWIRPTGTASSLVADLADGSRRMVGLGDLVEITGVVDRGGFAPTISATRILVVGTAPLPEPAAADLGRLFRGGDNAIRIEVGETFEAIVQGCRENRGEWNLVIDAAARKIVVRIAQSVMRTKPDHLVDARVRLVGVVGSTRNSRGQFLAPMLSIAAADDISVLEPAPSSPFESPRVSLDEIAAYRPEPVARHRIQTEGVVTCHVPGRYCYLQQGLVGLRVDCPSAPALEIGDVVRVAGFVDMSRTIAGIVEGVVEKTGRATPPSPVDIVPEEISRILMESHETGQMARPTNYAGVLIRFPATLIERQRFQDGWILTLARGQTTVLARLPTASADTAGNLGIVQPGSDVEVMGIARIDADLPADYVPSGRNPEVRPVELILRSAADVKIVRAPSWWTPQRLGAALAGVAGLLAAVLAWVWSLRRELAVQVDRVAHEIHSRREAEVEFEATLRERNRLAANLHDTLLQTIGGIRFQLDACRVAGREMDEAEAGEHFDVAQRMIDHAAQEVRGSVWALRTMPMPGKSFTDSIATVIGQFEKQLGKAHAPRISFRMSGGAAELPNFVAGNLLLVVQEAIHNAIRHGQPTQVEVAADFGNDGALAITVRDDGAGFLPGTEAGPAQGHFGLHGMRERLERLGGTLQIESSPGSGTTITAHVREPAREHGRKPEA
jgi:signal transduction histidine kinase